LLFLLYMMSKFQDYQPGSDGKARDKPGSRAAIVFNGSPLFTCGAGSGESEIRRWIIERDQLEAIVALPEQMFYNTDFGYRRINVLRPLRLRFQITDEARERFLNTCPELFNALQAVQDELGTETLLDWNRLWTPCSRCSGPCPTTSKAGPRAPRAQRRRRSSATASPRCGPRRRAGDRQAPQDRAAGPRCTVPRPDPARRHHPG
jgi:hypothetical protein